MGPIKACIKLFQSEAKYANYFYGEVRILYELSHENLPWLHGICNETKHPTVIMMSHHSFCGDTASVTLHVALNSSEPSN